MSAGPSTGGASVAIRGYQSQWLPTEKFQEYIPVCKLLLYSGPAANDSQSSVMRS